MREDQDAYALITAGDVFCYLGELTEVLTLCRARLAPGGLLLFIISLRNLVASDPHRTGLADDTLGAVPIGVPLIVGPATLTTTILLLDQHGAAATIAALLGNLLIVGATLHFAARIQRALGQSGAKALAKIAELLLAAIAVKIIRHGLETLAAGPAG